MNVTKDTLLQDILKETGSLHLERFINPAFNMTWDQFGDDSQRMKELMAGRTMSELTIGELAQVDPDWDGASMVEGMQTFVDSAAKGNFFHDIYKDTSLEGETMLCAMPSGQKKPFVVICPGGGYGGAATMVEGFPLVKPLLARGYSCFVLHYRCGKLAHYPNPTDDVNRAINYIFDHAEEFGVAKEYAVMGCSAGGHLAACMGAASIGWKKYGLPKPGMMFLAYPVVTCYGPTSLGSRNNLLQEDQENEAVQKQWSIEFQADKDYPPTFMWQCTGDPSVPVSGSASLAARLKEFGVPHVYETFDQAAHGQGLATGQPAEGWLERAVDFWESL